MGNTAKKKSPETIKQELIASITETADEKNYSGLNVEVKNTKSLPKKKTEKS